MMDGSRRITLRNRKFLKPIPQECRKLPYTPSTSHQQILPSIVQNSNTQLANEQPAATTERTTRITPNSPPVIPPSNQLNSNSRESNEDTVIVVPPMPQSTPQPIPQSILQPTVTASPQDESAMSADNHLNVNANNNAELIAAVEPRRSARQKTKRKRLIEEA